MFLVLHQTSANLLIYFNVLRSRINVRKKEVKAAAVQVLAEHHYISFC